MEKQLQMKSDLNASGHRRALRQRVNRCWDLLQQQHQQSALEKKSGLRGPSQAGLAE
jgi:hypothetical protein